MYQLFGFSLQTDFPLKTSLIPTSGMPDISFTCESSPPAKQESAPSLLLYKSEAHQDNVPLFSIIRYEQYDVLTFADIANFYVNDKEIVCHLIKSELQYLVEIRLLGSAMAYWLERQGYIALHASAVVVNGQAIAFIATSRGGKTSLAATFLQAGYSLLTDDILPVRMRSGAAIGNSGYPQMRMWPDQVKWFVNDEGSEKKFERIHPNYEKVRIPVTDQGWGEFCSLSTKLSTIYIPERLADAATDAPEIQITDVASGEAIFHLLHESFASYLNKVPVFGNRLIRIKELVNTIRVRKLAYSNGFSHLEAVKNAILKDIEANG